MGQYLGQIDALRGRSGRYIEELKEDRVSSQTFRKALDAEKVPPSTWTKVPQKIALLPKKDSMGKGLCFSWKLKGRSLVRITAEAFGLTEEPAN